MGTFRIACCALKLAALCLMGSAASAEEIELLSKSDALAMFGMSRSHWAINVQTAVALGTARALSTPDNEPIMVQDTPHGLLYVRPFYIKNENHPAVLVVTVDYRSSSGANLDDATIQDIIRTAEKQMKPEYDVLGDFQRRKDGLSINFVISQAVNK